MKWIRVCAMVGAAAASAACGDDGAAGDAGGPGTVFAGQGGDGDSPGPIGPVGDGDSAGPAGDGDSPGPVGPGPVGPVGDGDSAGPGGPGPVGDGDFPSVCMPDSAVFDSQVRPILDQRCGGCHGQTTNFGAPFPLTDYDALVAGEAPARIVDRIWSELAAGTMPPPGNLRPTPSEHDVLTGWVSCGEDVPTYPTGLQASQPVFESPESPPVGAELVSLTAENFPVPAQTKDHYQNFVFESVVDEEVFVRRFYVEIDKSRIVHHITLQLLPGQAYLYAWAPGTNAVELPDGGLRIGPNDRFRVQVHYNNLTDKDETDSSGMLMWVVPTAEKRYAMLDPATFAINVQPNARGRAEVNCVAENDFQVIAGMPHMHEIGDTFKHTLTRAGSGVTETMIELSGWSFDLQFFYAMPFEVKQGDTMKIECGYFNDKDFTVRAGQGTTDEMCYDFIYVTPENASLDCGTGFGAGRR